MFVALTTLYLVLRPGWFHYFFYRGNPKHNALHAPTCVVNVILVGSQNLALLIDILEMMQVIYGLCRTI